MRKQKLICTLLLSALISFQNKAQSNTPETKFRYAINTNQVDPKNARQSLVSVLKELNKEKGVYFLFSDSSLAHKMVNVPDLKGDIENILLQVLKNTGLRHKKISANTFVITSEKNNKVGGESKLYNLKDFNDGTMQWSSTSSASYATYSSTSNNVAQSSDKKITGKVTSSKDGTPLEGVSVKIKNGSKGTVTNADGSFSLTVADDASLEFSRVGFVTSTIKVTVSPMNVVLQEADNNLDDVVVVAYGTQKRTSYTGSSTTVRAQMIDDVPRSSVQESLQGNAPGVLATNGSGQPGTAPSIRIRGIGSISASSAPLYVVDGVPVVSGDISNGYGSNTIAALNASDIQSMVVLKDASATALYGSRGANGVILITTKKGKGGKTKFNFNVQQGVNLYTLRDKDKMMTTNQTIQYLREGWANAGKDPNLFVNEIIANGVDTTKNTDWFDEILHNGNYTRAGLSASGGNSKTTFYLSGSMYKQDAVQDGVGYNRITSLLNISHKETERFTVNAGISATYQKSNTFRGGTFFDNPIRALYRLQPWLTVYNPDGTYRTDYNSGYNPVAITNTNTRNTETYVIRGTLGAAYNIRKWLTYESKIGLDFSHAYNTLYRDPNYGNANVAANGEAGNYTQDIVNWVFTNILRAKKTFGDNSIESFVGYEASKRKDQDVEIEVHNIMPGLTSAANGTLPVLSTATNTTNTLVSAFFNTTYDHKNKYYLSGSIRTDGSSKFGASKRYGVFWSLGAAWLISKEKFFNVNWVNELKLRTSYGATGNSIGLTDFGARGLYNTDGSYNLSNGTYYAQLRNDSLTWEKNYPFNIGLDFTILKGRLSGTIEYYSRKTTDLLLSVPVPATNGISSYIDNFGSMKNYGFEFSLSSVNILPKNAKGFKWVTEINFSTNTNKVLKLNFPYTSNDFYRAEGLDFYQWRLKTYAGVDPANGQALWYSDSAKSVTTNNWSSGKYLTQGSALPKFYGGIMNSFSYKNFTLMFHIYYHWGNKVLDDNGTFTSSDGSMGFGNTSVIPRYNFENRWQKPGDVTNVPAPFYQGTQTGLNTQNSTRFLYDGSYVRLRDIQLSYNLPHKFLSKAKIASAKVYIRGNNLITWVKDKRLFFDPEVPVDGTLNQKPPVFKTFLAGIDINF